VAASVPVQGGNHVAWVGERQQGTGAAALTMTALQMRQEASVPWVPGVQAAAAAAALRPVAVFESVVARSEHRLCWWRLDSYSVRAHYQANFANRVWAFISSQKGPKTRLL
jgi:hypothetical protein